MSFTSTRGNRARVRLCPRRLGPRRLGLTLIEILISTAVTLIMIFAIVEIFERVGSAVAQGRAAIEMSGQIRGAAHRLREDLRGITVPMRPWPHSASSEGYFEYLEGPSRDATNLATNSVLGDVDDVIMFTARSVGEPWVGRFNGVAIESQVGEVVWWTRRDSTANVTLHRRVLLIRPDLNVGGNIPGYSATAANGPTLLQTFYNTNDVSARIIPDPNAAGQVLLSANTLGDLTKRENRFAHRSTPFPHFLDVSTAGNPMSLINVAQTGLQQGDDVILTHVQGFDIKAFDTQAQIRSDGVRALVPSDPGWAAAGSAIGLGAFVDLNYTNALVFTASSPVNFSGPAHPRSGLLAIAPASVYDTWSYHYEHDGVNQDGGVLDQGTDGLDNDGLNGPDDALERETSPPYPVPLRGIQIKIRIDDPDSRQVREMTVVHDFIPE